MKKTLLSVAVAALFAPLHILQAFPKGITPAKESDLGLQALMSNANAFSDGRVDLTTAGTAQAVTAAQVALGDIILAAGAGGAFTIDLPTAAAMIDAMGVTIPKDGTFSKILRIKNNNVGQTGTVTVASGDSANTTLTGTMTIATNTTRTFLLTITAAGAVTIENMGSMSL